MTWICMSRQTCGPHICSMWAELRHPSSYIACPPNIESCHCLEPGLTKGTRRHSYVVKHCNCLRCILAEVADRDKDAWHSYVLHCLMRTAGSEAGQRWGMPRLLRFPFQLMMCSMYIANANMLCVAWSRTCPRVVQHSGLSLDMASAWVISTP